MVGGKRYVSVEGFAHGLAVVPSFGDGEDFQIGVDAISNFQQDIGTGGDGRFAPSIFGSVRGIQRQLNVFGAGTRDLLEWFAIHGGNIVEVFTF